MSLSQTANIYGDLACVIDHGWPRKPGGNPGGGEIWGRRQIPSSSWQHDPVWFALCLESIKCLLNSTRYAIITGGVELSSKKQGFFS